MIAHDIFCSTVPVCANARSGRKIPFSDNSTQKLFAQFTVMLEFRKHKFWKGWFLWVRLSGSRVTVPVSANAVLLYSELGYQAGNRIFLNTKTYFLKFWTIGSKITYLSCSSAFGHPAVAVMPVEWEEDAQQKTTFQVLDAKWVVGSDIKPEKKIDIELRCAVGLLKKNCQIQTQTLYRPQGRYRMHTHT